MDCKKEDRKWFVLISQKKDREVKSTGSEKEC